MVEKIIQRSVILSALAYMREYYYNVHVNFYAVVNIIIVGQQHVLGRIDRFGRPGFKIFSYIMGDVTKMEVDFLNKLLARSLI